jgi:Protein of unknown function (DUF5672)/SEC-C motif
MTTRPRLQEVTLLTATSVNIDQTNAALLHCIQEIDFGAVKMLSSELPTVTDPRVEYIRIPPIDFLGYSRLIVGELNAYVQTSHCLVAQADGFVLDAALWRPQFLEYDYIGAPWPEYVALAGPGNRHLRLDKNSVGNGGFSLRSKKLLEITSRLRFDDLDFPIKSEDLLICHYLFDEMRAAGIRFAPPEIAALFSIESPRGLYGQSLDTVFGFHGKYWLARVDRKTALMNLHRDLRAGAGGSRDASIWGNVRRNEPCPCGSGKRYKHCHGSFNGCSARSST